LKPAKSKHKIINSKFSKSNSNSLTNQLGIHLILAKQEKLVFLANQLGKNRKLAKLTSRRVYMRADRGCHRRFPLGGG
jgi:hypothetical protein